MKESLPSEQFLLEVDLKREKVESFDGYPFSLDAVRNHL